MTDESLLLLENLTYLDNDIASAAGVTLPSLTSANNIGEYLAAFDETALKKLEGELKNSTTTGAEWAATIRAMKANPDICALTCRNYDSKKFAACFTDPNGKAYVAFQGTANADEWKDNFEGLNVSDTECQKAALDYIESLPYDDITVVGHSKGGNKAMYVTVTSDKVTHCVSMDGQGFSQEFLDKYSAEIAEKGGCITNYSLVTDYVHILMFQILNSNQRYFANGGKGGARNHAATAFYTFEQDENGDWQIRMDANGNPSMSERSYENQSIAYLHDFTCFVLNVMPNDKKQQFAEYLGILLALARDTENPPWHTEVNGVVYTRNNIKAFLASDPESLAIVLAYLLKYADTQGLSNDEVMSLLEAFGLDKALKEFKEVAHLAGYVDLTVNDILDMLLKQVKDGKRDPIIEKILRLLEQFLKEKFGVSIDTTAVWRATEREYAAIGDVDSKTSIAGGIVAGMRVFDYSQSSYDLLVQTIRTINDQTAGSVSGWNSYSSEEWYGKLHVSAAIRGVNGYYSYLAQINEDCIGQINRIYQNVRNIDRNGANGLNSGTEMLRSTATVLNDIASRVS